MHLKESCFPRVRNSMITPAGEIKDLTIPWLIQDLRAEKKTGTTVFANDAAVIKVFFNGGDIFFASSNLEEDRLGEYLMRTGKITKAQFDKSSETVVKTGKKLGAVLFEMGALTSQDLVAQVKLQVKEIILRLFSWRKGHYIFDNGPLPLSEIIPLHMSAGDVIIEGIRALDWKVVRKSLPPLQTIIRPAADPSHLFQSAHLDQDQKTVFSLVDGKKSIEELCTLSGIGDFNTLKAVYALLALRMTATGELKTEEEMKFARETVNAAVGVEAKKAAEKQESSISATRAMIESAYKTLELLNYYEILGVEKSATPQEIKKSYFHFAKLYHPDRHFEPEMSDLKEKLEALFTRVHSAYETLTTPAKRDSYNLDIASGVKTTVEAERREQRSASGKDVAISKFNEGMNFFSQGNYWGADEAFQWATRLDPTNAEYIFRRGLTLSRIPRRGHEAEEYYVKALEMAPSKNEYRIELANFYARSGLKAKAMPLYQEALRQDPNSEKIKYAMKKLNPEVGK